jgi:hypothetical protein
MGSPTRYACYMKKMMGWICEKMAIQESAQGGGRFSVQLQLETCNRLGSLQQPMRYKLKSLQRLVRYRRGLFKRCWEQHLGQRTYIRPVQHG